MRFGKKNIVSMALLLLAILWLFQIWDGREGNAAEIEFLGAAREVGGSCIRVSSEGRSFLVDCGALGTHEGSNIPERGDSIDFVLLTHAHSDHCGLLPELFERGFRGPVYCTASTAEIVPVILRMARGFSREKTSREAFDAALGALTPVPFDSLVNLGWVSFRFSRAGHILGAAFIETSIGSPNTGRTRIVFSGDLGSGMSLMLPPPDPCPDADYVVIESTYGAKVRDHGKGGLGGKHAEFAEAVSAALARGGDVLIPAFTLGRTQEVIAALDLNMDLGRIPRGTKIFCDSPTANRISDIYRDHPDDLSQWARDFYGARILSGPSLREVRSSTSMKVHDRKHDPAVFISSSGDLDHANSPRHLARMFGSTLDLVCIVGWQPPGSLGYRLLNSSGPVLLRHREGKEYVREWITPSIGIERFGSFSAHADQDGLISWLRSCRSAKKIFIVHGEESSSLALSKRISSELGIEAVVPYMRDRFDLDPAGREIASAGVPVPDGRAGGS